ncbi:MAG: NAD(P)-dependent oxidoreductase [Actinomycetota bacterium]|nr:NAD(P)-dependent oxidoreductase [Actinomycetota bacterium]MDQ2956608.1 NAD(P)-dependent oxidoreductase [Actinomycetota bacterium]
MTVLLTGAQGRIGSSLTELLPGLGWQLRTFDRSAGGDLTGELTDPAVLDRAMAGVEAVVHLAGQPTEGSWSAVRDSNIEGLFQLFEAARRAGVRRVVYASSNHAVGFTPRGTAELPADTPPRPDTLYGVSKAFGEALGRYYCDRYGFQVACLRIGTFGERPPDQRAQNTWLAPSDCARLVDACLRSEQLDFAQIWGISANRHRWWSLAAGERIGYHPVEDAGEYGPAPQPDPTELVGGRYAGPAFGIDEVARQNGEEEQS